jgi:hypothetical protein
MWTDGDLLRQRSCKPPACNVRTRQAPRGIMKGLPGTIVVGFSMIPRGSSASQQMATPDDEQADGKAGGL